MGHAASSVLCSGLLGALALGGCDGLRACAVRNAPNDWGESTAHAGVELVGTFDGLDAGRAQLPLRLRPVLSDAKRATDVQFPPGRDDLMVVTRKSGQARVARLVDDSWRWAETLFELEVLKASEQGLLGLAFAPDFAESGHLFVHHSVAEGGEDLGRISRFTVVDPAAASWTVGAPEMVLQVAQPYANHNAGQLVFGPDGMLYIGFGDGGWRDDPHGHGQNPDTWLGSMLRVDVSSLPYSVPPDNPFLDQPGVRPEIWATGLRNPWRYSFASDGRLVVADVGQNKWEEIDIVAAGDNLGWNTREGRHCFPATVDSCPEAEELGLVEPIYEYGRKDGQSITGGYIYGGASLPSLRGRYIFGDFATGRLWAIDLPEAVGPGTPLVEATALGRFPILPATFGMDASGELYVADYGKGGIYQLVGG